MSRGTSFLIRGATAGGAQRPGIALASTALFPEAERLRHGMIDGGIPPCVPRHEVPSLPATQLISQLSEAAEIVGFVDQDDLLLLEAERVEDELLYPVVPIGDADALVDDIAPGVRTHAVPLRAAAKGVHKQVLQACRG